MARTAPLPPALRKTARELAAACINCCGQYAEPWRTIMLRGIAARLAAAAPVTAATVRTTLNN